MAVKLSARLSQISSYIKAGESVCDVGTDHGYLPIFLAEQGGHDPLVMSDVSKGSLNKAVADAKMVLSDDDLPTARLGDGLDVLSPGEVDDIVIAGMGGIQILDILTWDFAKTLTYGRYIFQPRRDAALLRKWLEVNKFTIIEQCIVPENGRYSQIICASTEKAERKDIDFYERMTLLEVFSDDPDKLAEYEYPEDIDDPSGGGVRQAYYEAELSKEQGILANIADNSSKDDASAVMDIHKARILRLQVLLGQQTA